MLLLVNPNIGEQMVPDVTYINGAVNHEEKSLQHMLAHCNYHIGHGEYVVLALIWI